MGGPPFELPLILRGVSKGESFGNRWVKLEHVLTAIAGTAHWQQGKIERHNQTIKICFRAL